MKNLSLILRPLGLSIAALALLSSLSCDGPDRRRNTPAVIDGVADLRGIDLEKSGPIALKGSWDFAWMGETPDIPEPGTAKWDTIAVPGYWNATTGIGQGCGWYRARVRVDSSGAMKDLSLFLKGANTAYSLYVNGKEIMKSGVAGRSAAATRPLLLPQMRQLPPLGPDRELVIIVRVSNFHHRGGGLNKAPVIGTAGTLGGDLWREGLVDTLALGFILMIAGFHGLQWLGRRDDRTSLYFAVMCLSVFFHTFARDNFIERIFPAPETFPLRFTMEYAFLALSWMSAALFVSRLYPNDMPRACLRGIAIPGILSVVVILSTPVLLSSKLVPLFSVQLLVAGSIILGSAFAAALRGREDGRLVFAGFFLFFLTIVNDTLFNFNLVPTGFISQYGLCLMVFFQSAVISLRSARAHRTAEHLSAHLQEEVAQKTAALQRQAREAVVQMAKTDETYRRLEEVHAIMKSDLHLASVIQESLLPRGLDGIPECRIMTEYRPLMEIGGDFFDIHRLGDGAVRVFLADAVGHGISASLVTLLIKGEYDRLKSTAAGPREVFEALNDVFFNRFSSLRISFTGVIMDIDTRTGSLTFASAGHPPQYLLRRGEVTALEHTCRGIGFFESIGGRSRQVPCERGDIVVLLTDGIYEQINASGEEYGWDRFKSNLNGTGQRSLESIMKGISGSLAVFEQCDDITVIGIEILAGGGGAGRC